MSNDPSGESPYGHRPPPPKKPGALDNPYASGSLSASKEPYPPGKPGYVRLKPHRGGAVLALGLSGMMVALFGGLLAMMFYICCPIFLLPLGSLGLSVPAWIMGQSDMAAIKAGVMDPAGRDTTMIGMISGIVGVAIVVLGVVTVVGIIAVSFFLAIVSEMSR